LFRIGAGAVAQVVKNMLSKCGALSLSPGAAINQSINKLTKSSKYVCLYDRKCHFLPFS
jgi:hypothetical protein